MMLLNQLVFYIFVVLIYNHGANLKDYFELCKYFKVYF